MQETNYARMIKGVFASFRQKKPPEIPEFWRIVINMQVGLLGPQESAVVQFKANSQNTGYKPAAFNSFLYDAENIICSWLDEMP